MWEQPLPAWALVVSAVGLAFWTVLVWRLAQKRVDRSRARIQAPAAGAPGAVGAAESAAASAPLAHKPAAESKRLSITAAVAAVSKTRVSKTIRHVTQDKVLPALRTTRRLKNIALLMKLVETKTVGICDLLMIVG